MAREMDTMSQNEAIVFSFIQTLIRQSSSTFIFGCDQVNLNSILLFVAVQPDVPAQPTSMLLAAASFGAPPNNLFTYEELERATNGFSEANFLGEGSFGPVYKGVLQDGREVAIKHLKHDSKQGEREFLAEVEIISRVHHKNLVSLAGYSICSGQLMLVYDFVPNETLKSHLHGKERPTMEWHRRQKIALGIAKGLYYLHEQCQQRIVHRDIKSDNILLDFNWEAKIADFGLARIFPDNQTHIEATKMAGTLGYLAPEYASVGELTDKSDVYSFGVVLLELITGRLPVTKKVGRLKAVNLVEWARDFIEGKSYDELVDPRLKRNYNDREMIRLVKCAAACVCHDSASRPKMHEVVAVLQGHLSAETLNEVASVAERPKGNTSNHPRTFNPVTWVDGTSEYSGSIGSYGSHIPEEWDTSKRDTSERVVQPKAAYRGYRDRVVKKPSYKG